MNKLLIVSIAILFLAGCSEKDENYFFKNQQEAATQLKTCEAQLTDAFENGDEKAMKEIDKDKTCVAARNALEKQKSIDIKAKANKKANDTRAEKDRRLTQ